jgi:hypothetical protein
MVTLQPLHRWTLTNAFNATGKFSDDPAIGSAKLAGMELTDDLKGLFRTSPPPELGKDTAIAD